MAEVATTQAPGESPFHPGELALQARLGVRESIEAFGRRAIRDAMPEQHRTFFAALPFIVVGALDARQRPWASVLVGAPGFMTTPDARTLRINARPVAGDPVGAGLHVGAPVGLLGIEPHTRRRNRLNGIVMEADARGLAVGVRQSYGNCPKYIQARTPAFDRGRPAAPARRSVQHSGARLDARAVALVSAADTFFIATASRHAVRGGAGEGVDVSHRGGKPGFVRVDGADGRTVLTVPDFVGNSLFNTLGNIAVHPHAGLVFVDFESGDALVLTATARIVWEGAELRSFAGAQRLLVIRVDDSAWIHDAVPLRWSTAEQAHELDATGAWGGVR